MVYSSALKLTQGKKINLIDFLVSVYAWLKIREVIGMSRISCAFIFVVGVAVIFFFASLSTFFLTRQNAAHKNQCEEDSAIRPHVCIYV